MSRDGTESPRTESLTGRPFGEPESGEWCEHVGDVEILREPNLVYGWALYSGTGGDDPYFVGFFADKGAAQFLLDSEDADDEPLIFDGAVVPAMLLGDHKRSCGAFVGNGPEDEAKAALVERFGGDVRSWDRQPEVLP